MDNQIFLIHLGRRNAGPRILYRVAEVLSENGYLAGLFFSRNKNHGIVEFDNFRNSKSIKTYSTFLGFIFSIFTLPIKSLIILLYIKNTGSKKIMFLMPHMWDFFLIPFLSLFGRFHIIYWVHDAKPHPGDSKIASFMSHVIAIKYANIIVSLSQFVTDSLKTSKKVIQIKHPVDSDFQSHTKLIKDSSSPKLIFFGRLVKYKGLERLKGAWDKFQNQHVNSYLMIAGNGRQEYIFDIFKTSKNVIFKIQYLEEYEVQSLLQEYDVLVIPYDEASQSGVLAQAIENGIRYVATPVGALREQNRIFGGGIIAKDMSIDSYVEALNEACAIDKLEIKESGQLHDWRHEIKFLIKELEINFKD